MINIKHNFIKITKNQKNIVEKYLDRYNII